MEPDLAQQLSITIESLLCEILPDLDRLLQHYQISKALELNIVGINQLSPTSGQIAPTSCCVVSGILRCNCNPTPPGYGSLNLSDDSLGLGSEKTQQLCEDVASKLAQIVLGLSQSIPQSNESFEIHLLLDSATVSQHPMICKWSGDTSQGNILQCSNP